MLPADFYNTPTQTLAKQLLGKYFFHIYNGETIGGYIVETEAYLHNDPACHASRGKTKRNAPMFGKPGTIYIYQIYGIHWCINIVTDTRQRGEAILLRAIQPTHGIPTMKQLRNTQDIYNVANGPAKLFQATALSDRYNTYDLTQKNSQLIIQQGYQPEQITTTTRIGITKGADLPLRFYITNNPYVSKPIKKR